MIKYIIPILIICCSSVMKGVWLPISGTPAPLSESGIIDAVDRCSNLTINTIYFAVWNQLMINFTPSNHSLFEKYPFLKTNPNFTFNPLEILIRESHKKGIKVIGWFEFGFATTYNDPTGGVIFSYKPQWKAIDHDGNLVSKNNFQWMNAFNPQVQQFMLDLLDTLLISYPEIDGIQGDDRMPSLPSVAGYDNYTLKLYKQSHENEDPPSDYTDPEWIQWRCNLLSDFMRRVFLLVRSHNYKYQIQMSPLVYPFSKREYLQDWPVWVQYGWVDVIVPQIYRYDIAEYRSTLLSNIELVKEKKDQFYPGILIGLGSDPVMNAKNLETQMKLNRELDLKGQVYFYYESIKDRRVAETIISI